MTKLPKVIYLLLMLVVITALSGCQLRRDDALEADPGPVAIPPTLAPLGAETVLAAAETTTVNGVVQEQAMAVIVTENQPATLAEPETVVSGEATLVEVASETVTEDTTAAVTEDAVVASVAEDTIIVSASDDLPIGEPVASSPTFDQSTGDYVAPAVGDGGVYIVRPGDTLFGVAQLYGTTVEAIVYANGLPSDVIQIGQQLSIPAGTGGPVYSQEAVPQQPYQQPGPGYQAPAYPQQPGTGYPQQGYTPTPGDQYHLVYPGETLYSIAMQYGTTVDAIASTNGIAYPYIIQVGQPLIVPAAGGYSGYPQPYQAYGQPQPYDQQQPYQGYAQPQPYDQQQPYQGYAQPQPYDQQQPYQGYAQPQPYDQQQPYPQPPQGNFMPVPGGVGTHTVSPGETLFSIAMAYGTSAEMLASANGVYNPNQIYVGQVLFLP